jgi:hypothetical protein
LEATLQGVSAAPQQPGGEKRDIDVVVPPTGRGKEARAKGAESLSLSLVAAGRYQEEWAEKSEAEFFAYAMDASLQIFSELKQAEPGPFWRPVALAYFDQARELGHLETMAYDIRRSLADPEVIRWLEDHAAAVKAYRSWSKGWVESR